MISQAYRSVDLPLHDMVAGLHSTKAPNPQQCVHCRKDCAHSTRGARQRIPLATHFHGDLGLAVHQEISSQPSLSAGLRAVGGLHSLGVLASRLGFDWFLDPLGCSADLVLGFRYGLWRGALALVLRCRPRSCRAHSLLTGCGPLGSWPKALRCIVG